MELQNIEANITLDLYNHDTTPSTIKAIQLDSQTRYVAAMLQSMGAEYGLDSGATVQLIVIRPDKVGVQITGTTFTYGDEGAQFLGPYAELTQVALAVNGKMRGQFKITSGTQILRTEIFAISNGEALDASTDEWADEYDGYDLAEMATSIETNTEDIATLEADVSQIKEDLTDLLDGDINKQSLWEQGMINSTTGQNSPSTAGQTQYRIRTISYIPSSVVRIVATTGFVQVYKYKMDGTFVETITWIKDYTLVTGYKYRAVYTLKQWENVEIDVSYYGNVQFLLENENIKASSYYRNVNYGNPYGLGGYYTGKGSDYSLFSYTTMSSEIYTLFDALATANPYYITKTDLGASSNNDHLYSYDFCPKYREETKKPMPKIIIISGQHGFEKSSVYGLYYLMRDICSNWKQDGILEYLRNHVQLIVIPVVNRYGFDNIVYKNANGVNLNRNYDTPEFVVGDNPTASSYGGAVPFDQPETQIVRDLVLANKDALALLDWHNTGGGKVAEYTDINWLSITNFDKDLFLAKGIDAGAYHISNITAHMPDDYNLPVGSSMCGYMTINVNELPTAGRWARCNDMLGMTFETPNGFPNEASAFSQDEQKANSELMGNWLASLLSIYAQEG